jgi:hypothetical protein
MRTHTCRLTAAHVAMRPGESAYDPRARAALTEHTCHAWAARAPRAPGAAWAAGGCPWLTPHGPTYHETVCLAAAGLAVRCAVQNVARQANRRQSGVSFRRRAPVPDGTDGTESPQRGAQAPHTQYGAIDALEHRFDDMATALKHLLLSDSLACGMRRANRGPEPQQLLMLQARPCQPRPWVEALHMVP